MRTDKRRKQGLGDVLAEEIIPSVVGSLQRSVLSPLGSLKRGGRVHKTGLYRLHAGEDVVPASRAKRRQRSKRS